MAESTASAVRARRRRRRRRRVIVTSVVVVVVAAGAGTAWAMQGSDGPQYRLTTVTRGSVSQTVDSDGSLAAKRVVESAFAVAGTVSSVKVAVGDTVTAGQTLATLDRTSLDSAVTSAKTALATAEQTLTDAENGIVDANTGTGRTGSGSSSSGLSTNSLSAVKLTAARTDSPKSGGSDPSSTQLSTALQKDADQVENDANDLVTLLNSISSSCALTTEQVSSVKVTLAADDTISGTVDYGDVGKATVTISGQTDPVSIASDGTWTSAVLPAGTYTVATSEQVVSDASECSTAVSSSAKVTQALGTFETALAKLRDAVASSSNTGSGSTGSTGPTGSTGAGSTGSKTGSGTGSGGGTGTRTGSGASTGSGRVGAKTGTGTSTGSGSPSSSGTTSTVVTAELIAADSAAVTQAKADLALAKQQLAQATLTSTISGTVAAVTLTRGGSVSAGSSSSTVTVVGTGALSVDLTIPLTSIDLVKVGQTAQVTVDGRSAPLPAKVTYVGVVNSASSGSTASYPVTVQLDATSSDLYDGMGAQVAIDVGTATNALLVPLSALTAVGSRTIVEVYRSGKVVDTVVTLGVVGNDAAQVTKGLSAGQQIVLADASEAVPSTTSTSTTGRFGRTGSGLSGLTGTGGLRGAGGLTGGGNFPGRN